MVSKRLGLALILVVFFVSSCVTPWGKGRVETPTPPSHKTKVVSEGEKHPVVDQGVVGQEKKTSEETVETMEGPKPLFPMSEEKKKKIVVLPLRVKGVSSKELPVSVNFDDTDITDIVKSLLGDTLGINYVIDPSVRGKITIHTQGKLKGEDILNLLSTILQMNNVSLIKKGKVYYVVPSTKAPVMVGRVGGRGKLVLVNGIPFIQIVALKYIRAESALKLIRPFISKGAVTIVDQQTNSIIISDTPENIKKAISIISAVDEDVFSNMYFDLIPIKYMKVGDVESVLRKIFRSPLVKRSSMAPRFEFIPIRASNSILVVARDPEDIEGVKELVSEIDVEEESTRTGVYIYPVENGNAEDIANILKELYGSGARKTSGGRVVVVRARKRPSGAAVSSGELTSEVKIIPDKTNNIIIIKATPEDYRVIRSVLERIDIVPRQVLIEVLVAEVSLNKEIDYGVEWFLKNNKVTINGNTYRWNVSLNEGTPLSSTTPLGSKDMPAGISYAIFSSSGELRSLIRALSSISKINVLSSPTILATDNQEARIDVGKEVPVISQSVVNTSSETPNITYNVQYRNTGIILKVKPHINSSGLVSMDISQEVSEAQENKISNISSPIILKRKAETHVVVKSGQTILMGGLIQENKNLVKTGVPLLKDIPILGHIFSSTTWKKDRTELLIAITPHVVRNQEEARAITEEFGKNIDELKKALRGKSEMQP